MISTPTQSKVQLEVFELNSGSCNYQTLAINLLEPKSLIAVDEMLSLELPAELNLQREIILYGSAPIWLYSHLVECFHDVPWVACYDIRSQTAVVVSSKVSQVQPGDTIPIIFNRVLGPAILISGAPDSGKSVLSYALRVNLAAKRPDTRIYLHRANWDGEGNHTHENPNQDLAKRLKDESKFKIHLHPNASQLMPEYFAYHADAVRNIQQVVNLTLVDVGGIADSIKMPVIEQCSHYIVISKYPDKIQEWHNLCGGKLKPLAIIHSVWEDRLEVLRTEPFLEIVAGKWQASARVPEVLLEKVLGVLP